MNNIWEPSPIIQHVYDELIDHFSEPDHAFTFDSSTSKYPTPEHFPDRIDVFAWEANDEINITNFATVGMSSKPMNGCDHRCEIHFGIRASLSESDLSACAKFLANLTTYPFYQQTYLDWWHKIRKPGEIPLYSHPSILLYPGFTKETWDHMHFEDLHIKILNVIPISSELFEIPDVATIQERIWSAGDPFVPQ